MLSYPQERKDRAIRILILSQLWEPEQGIPQRRWKWLVGALTQAGHQVDVVCPPPHYPGGKLLSYAPRHQRGAVERVNRNLTIFRSRFRTHDKTLASRIKDQAVVAVSTVRLAMRVAKHRRPDLVICTAPPLPIMFAQRFLCMVMRLPAVIDLRDAWPDLLKYIVIAEADTSPSLRQSQIKAMVFNTLGVFSELAVRHCLKHARGVVVTSKSFAGILRNRIKAPVQVVYNTGDLHAPVTSRDREDDGCLHVLYAGTVGRAQGMIRIVGAIRKLTEQGVPIKLRVIGGGAHRATLREIAQKENLPIEFFDTMPREKLVPHYEWADTLLVILQPWLPLEWTVPSKLFDSMSVGKHVTLCAKGEAVRILCAAKAGHWVERDVEDGLVSLWRKLAENRALLKIGESGHHWLDLYAHPRCQELGLLSFLEKVRK